MTDVAEFEDAIKTAANSIDRESQACALHTAIDLYRGDLLPGYFEECVVSERERLEEAYAGALMRYSRVLADSGDLNAAIDVARRALSRDPLREDVHCDLMRLFTAMGRTSDAIRQYRDLERLLREELGATPSGSTREEFDRLQLR